MGQWFDASGLHYEIEGWYVEKARGTRYLFLVKDGEKLLYRSECIYKHDYNARREAQRKVAQIRKEINNGTR